MANPALAVVGLAAAVGVFLAVRYADSDEPVKAPEEVPEPTPAPIPDPISMPVEPGADLPPDGPAASGVPGPAILPPELQTVNLSGLEEWAYEGVHPVGEIEAPFHIWRVDNSLNGMSLYIYVSEERPDNWVSYFLNDGGFGIVYKVSSSGQNTTWMLENIVGQR